VRCSASRSPIESRRAGFRISQRPARIRQLRAPVSQATRLLVVPRTAVPIAAWRPVTPLRGICPDACVCTRVQHPAGEPHRLHTSRAMPSLRAPITYAETSIVGRRPHSRQWPVVEAVPDLSTPMPHRPPGSSRIREAARLVYRSASSSMVPDGRHAAAPTVAAHGWCRRARARRPPGSPGGGRPAAPARRNRPLE